MLLDRRPFLAAVPVFGDAGLEAAFVGVRARIADVLMAVGLGEEQAEADAASNFRLRRIEALRARNRGAERDNVLERRVRFLRVGGRRLHQGEQRLVFIEQRLVVGVEIGRRDVVFVRPSDPRRQQRR